MEDGRFRLPAVYAVIFQGQFPGFLQLEGLPLFEEGIQIGDAPGGIARVNAALRAVFGDMLPAPITTLLPMVTPRVMMTFMPMNTLSPMVTLPLAPRMWPPLAAGRTDQE